MRPAHIAFLILFFAQHAMGMSVSAQYSPWAGIFIMLINVMILGIYFTVDDRHQQNIRKLSTQIVVPKVYPPKQAR